MFLTLPAAQHQTFTIKDASPKYSVTIQLTSRQDKGDIPDMVPGPGTVTLRLKGNGKVLQIITMKSIAVFKKQLATSVGKEGQQPSMYDDNYSLVFEDFNFDGRQDFAICNGTDSGYGGPSYDVFLFDPKHSRFTKNDELSKLASEHLGLFETDPKNHTLLVYDKSGAAWHQETTYRFAQNKLVKIKVVVDDATGKKDVVTTQVKAGNKWKTTRKILPLPPTGE